MKVIHLCGGKLEGGAAKGATVLHSALLRAGVDSTLYFSQGDNESHKDRVYPFIGSKKVWNVCRRVIPRIDSTLVRIVSGERGTYFSPGILGYPLDFRRDEIEACDIVHLHWINGGFLSLNTLTRIGKPLVWTLRDEWPFTGGCHYTCNCTRYLNSCGACPVLNSARQKDLSSWNYRQKKNLNRKSIHYVGISDSITKKAKNSSLLRDKKVTRIYNSIDLDFFQVSRSSLVTRKEKNISKNSFLILAGAKSLDSPFKGYDLLRKLDPLDFPADTLLVTFGAISQELKSSIKIPTIHFGEITSNERLIDLYTSADLFIAPSKQEAFGKTLAEAGACGLPVICYDIDGPSEIVIDQLTGFKVKDINEERFIEKMIELAYDRRLCEKMGVEAKKNSDRFSPDLAARCYLEIYKEILKSE